MGVIKDGYYYPSPEEIFIGYQCEVNWNRGYEEVFVPYEVRLKEAAGAYVGDIDQLTIAIDDGYAEVRVLLLSKEDIESLGWAAERSLSEYKFSSQGKTWYMKLHHNGIWIQYMPTDYGITIYQGPCPTINELRTLMRILEIK